MYDSYKLFILCFHLVTTILSGVLVCYAILLRRVPHTLWFAFLAIISFFYNLGFLLEGLSSNLESAYLACRVQYIGIAFLAPVFFLFTREYFNRPVTKKWQMALLLIPLPLFSLVASNSWPYSQLYYKDLSYLATPSPILVVTPGPMYYLVFSAILLLFGASIGEALHSLQSKHQAEKSRAITFLAMGTLPLITTIAGTISGTPIHLIPISFSIILMMLSIDIYRFRAEEWRVRARERVLEGINDAFILLDNDNCFLDANAIAYEYFPAMRNLESGASIELLADFPTQLLEKNTTFGEFSLTINGETVHLGASSSDIYSNGKSVGNCIMIYDHTKIHNLMQELNELAAHDALTGLYNRGTFFRLAEHDFQLSVRNQSPFTILMLDIDHFKKVNDQYGHLCGDSVLKLLADLLTSRLRKTDILGRYGGEELIICLPNTNRQDALALAETLRISVEEYLFPSPSNSTFQVTISLGLVQLDPHRHTSIECMISDADIALYQAKTNGRNCVVSVTDEMASEIGRPQCLQQNY